MTGSGATKGRRVCLGALAGAHGVRGEMKAKSFTQVPEDLVAYGPLENEAGDRRFRLTLKGNARDLLVVAAQGVGDRDAAQALKGTRLYIDRAALPEPEEEETYYYADLVGLRVEDESGQTLGRVKTVNNHGAGDYLEVERPADRDLVVPFTADAVPLVDIRAGRVVLSQSALADEGDGNEGERGDSSS